MNQQQLISYQQPSEEGVSYRLVSKSFFCHCCRKSFKKMVPATQPEEVQCPQCNNDFVEEMASGNENPANLYRQTSAPAA